MILSGLPRHCWLIRILCLVAGARLRTFALRTCAAYPLRSFDPAARHKVGGAFGVDARGMGVGDRQGCSGLARLKAESCVALGHRLLHHSGWNVAPHRASRLAHSLKRGICPVAANHHADSPISMTSPRTTLKRGQYTPLPKRSSAAPHSTLPQRRHAVFLRRDLRRPTDYFAHTSIGMSFREDAA